MLKEITTLVFLTTLVNSKELHLNNNLNNDIEVTILAVGYFQIPAGSNLTVTAPDRWNGAVVARNIDCAQKECSMYQTSVSIIFQPEVNEYMVSLVFGFNLPITVIPEPKESCASVSCAHKELLDDCPDEEKVIIDGKLVACKYAPDLFQKYCPTSYIDFEDDRMVTCPTAVAYTINFGFES